MTPIFPAIVLFKNTMLLGPLQLLWEFLKGSPQNWVFFGSAKSFWNWVFFKCTNSFTWGEVGLFFGRSPSAVLEFWDHRVFFGSAESFWNWHFLSVPTPLRRGGGIIFLGGGGLLRRFLNFGTTGYFWVH